MLDRDGTASRSVVMARCHVQRDSASMVDCDICLDVPFGLSFWLDDQTNM